MYTLNENEKNSLQRKMIINDFKTCYTDFFETKEYKDLATEMIINLGGYEDHELFFKNCTKNQLLEAGRLVINNHMYDSNIKVRYVDMDALTAEIFTIFGDEPKEDKYDEIIKYIDNNVSLIKVTSVPVELDFSKKRNGHAKSTVFFGSNQVNNDYYKKVKPAIQKITLEGNCDDDTKCTYVHEMYHALADSHKGCIENLLHNEVLSIYMEKIAGLDLDPTGELEKLNDLTRLLNNKNDVLTREYLKFNDERVLDRIDCETYILSTAIATALFNTYKKSNKTIKREIDDSISGIFREDHTLEDMLQQFEITPENGSNMMRRHIKKLSK